MVNNRKKRCKKFRGGGSSRVSYNFDNKELILIGVNHERRDLSFNDMKEIVDIANKKRNVCYLIEFDKRLTNHQLKGRIPNVQEMTTKVIMPVLKREYKETFSNLCIRGWDVRQSLIGQQNQNILYSKRIYNSPLGHINQYISKIPNSHKINSKLYEPKIAKYLQSKFDDPETYFRLRKQDNKMDNLWKWIMKETNNYVEFLKQNNNPYKKVEEYTLKELRKVFKPRDIDALVTHLLKTFANYSDLIVLERILQKNNNKTYIIFLGLKHYENIRQHLANMKIK